MDKTQAEDWRKRLYHVIFEAETPGGKAFDVFLLIAILGSVLAVVLDSVPGLRDRYGFSFDVAEWVFTILFTIEYLIRILTFPRPKAYIFSFFGLVDLLSILPTYLSLFFVGMESLLVIRALRLLRVFRVLKLLQFSEEAIVLLTAVRRSSVKIIVFLGAVFTIVIIAGATMYLLEGERHGFTSIPKAMYWAIVTMTTVGYGDLTPQTDIGKLFASFLMVMGYGIIAVPTGIVSVEIAQVSRFHASTRVCPSCNLEGHAVEAKFCRACGSKL